MSLFSDHPVVYFSQTDHRQMDGWTQLFLKLLSRLKNAFAFKMQGDQKIRTKSIGLQKQEINGFKGRVHSKKKNYCEFSQPRSGI